MGPKQLCGFLAFSFFPVFFCVLLCREVGHDSRKGSFEMSTIMRGVYEKPINGKILPFELRSCASKSSSKADEAQNNPAPR